MLNEQLKDNIYQKPTIKKKTPLVYQLKKIQDGKGYFDFDINFKYDASKTLVH